MRQVWVYCLESMAKSISSHCISLFLRKTNCIKTSTRKEKNKAHSPVASHRFAGNLLGVCVDVTGQMNCAVCQMRLFTAGKHIQSKHSSCELISISMGKESEEEKVWLLADVRHLARRLKTACVRVCLRVSGMSSLPAWVPPLCLPSGLNARQILSYDLIHCKAKKEREVLRQRQDRFKSLLYWSYWSWHTVDREAWQRVCAGHWWRQIKAALMLSNH